MSVPEMLYLILDKDGEMTGEYDFTRPNESEKVKFVSFMQDVEVPNDLALDGGKIESIIMNHCDEATQTAWKRIQMALVASVRLYHESLKSCPNKGSGLEHATNVAGKYFQMTNPMKEPT